MRVASILPLCLLLACAAAPPPAAPPPVTAPKCRAPGEDIRSWGAEARTIDVVLYGSMQRCINGDARHFEVQIDGRFGKAVELPCWNDLLKDKVEIIAPPPGYDGGTFVVDEGIHAVAVVDLDTRHQDHERFSVPHVELLGDDIVAGNHVEAWVSADGVSVRGPAATQPWRM